MLRIFQNLAVAAFFLAASIAFAVVAREDAESFQSCQKAQYQTNSTSKQEPKSLAFFFERWIAYRCTARFIEAHNSVITAIATVLLTFVTGGLVWTGYQQIRTTRFQLRAYVFPDSCLVWDGTTLATPIPIHTNEPGVVLVWRNTGQTPALNVVSWGQVSVIEPINEHTLVVPPLRNIFSNNLGANSVANKALWFGRALTPNEIADVVAGVRAIYLFGRIEYHDIFKRKRWTNFRLAYSGHFPPSGGVFNVCEKGNTAE